jgi:hypothetical protein
MKGISFEKDRNQRKVFEKITFFNILFVKYKVGSTPKFDQALYYLIGGV